MILVMDLFLRSRMAELQLDPHKTALVPIDLQNAIVAMSTARHPGQPPSVYYPNYRAFGYKSHCG